MRNIQPRRLHHGENVQAGCFAVDCPVFYFHGLFVVVAGVGMVVYVALVVVCMALVVVVG